MAAIGLSSETRVTGIFFSHPSMVRLVCPLESHSPYPSPPGEAGLSSGVFLPLLFSSSPCDLCDLYDWLNQSELFPLLMVIDSHAASCRGLVIITRRKVNPSPLNSVKVCRLIDSQQREDSLSGSEMKTKDLPAAIFCLLIGWEHLQVNGATYKLMYKANVFDDQYIGCAEELTEAIMPWILQKEKANQQFGDAWKMATKEWNKMASKLDLPDEFEDEYGIALLVFTNQIPEGNPIYQQLNANLAVAGASVKSYLDNFHFKALHFYLTRAVQILKPDCSRKYTTFRGSEDTYKVSPLLKFGRFTSTSLNSTMAQTFGTASPFQITTCFGAKIGQFSFFPKEDEVLIPPTEQFTYVMRRDSAYILESTGQMCSYFNCAIKGGEKQTAAVCHSDSSKLQNFVKKKKMSSPAAEQEERISALEDRTIQNHEDWDQNRQEVRELTQKAEDTLQHLDVHQKNIDWLLRQVE
ncbi:PREDICTED: uncharacterized protein LOC108803089, partial [Nanorana parkeri]|uniref:uncharacterized protein LOC108803089 n=1 Tax=Nanorana parkeri TaxID=125878 RepID=UPI000854994F